MKILLLLWEEQVPYRMSRASLCDPVTDL